MRTNLFHIVLLATFLTAGTNLIYSQKSIVKTAEKQDSKAIVKATDLDDKAGQKSSDTIKKKKSALTGIVRRKAQDYERIDQKNKTITLYNNAELYYEDIELKAGIIVFDYGKNEVYAGRIKDEKGNYTQLPRFKQGVSEVKPDSIRFNYNTKRALVWNSRTKQQDLNIIAEISKKENDSVYFMKNAKITTAVDIDDPEYYFLARKAKFVPGKKVVVGFTNMYVANVPTPLALPFAFFPMMQQSQSGIIIPTFQDTQNRGYSIQNGGYYFALSDKYDLSVLGDYYTNGSYGLRMQSSYAQRYKFRGSTNFRYENQIISEKGFPDYSRTKIYNIQWNHSQDAKASPNSTFSASVNLGSSNYYQNSLNIVNAGSQLNNTMSSSVSYSKTFQSVPLVNTSFTATHSQNTQTKEINLTLPTFQTSVDRIFPFAPKDGSKKGLIKNVNLQYSVRGENRLKTTDADFMTSRMFEDAKFGFQHTIPLSTNFKVFKHFSVTTGANYNEVWYFKTIRKDFDSTTNQVATTEVNGFDSYRTITSNISIGTTIYGTFNFGRDKKIQTIRHVVRPSITHNYTPSYEKYYDTYATDASGNMQSDYSRFEQGLFGAPNKNYSNLVGIGLNNVFEAKVKNKDSSKKEAKKIMLLNNLNLATSYNFAADSLAWTPMRISGGTLLLKDKMNVNFATTLDPYALNSNNQRINTFNIDNGGSLFRMTSANMTVNYSLTSNDYQGGKKTNTQGAKNGGREDDLFGVNADLSDRRESQFGDDEDTSDDKKEVTEFFNYKLPWDLTLAYALTYSNMSKEDKLTGNSLMFSGNLQISPKWKIGGSSGYDFIQRGVTYTQLRFERDLMSWRMDLNWSPIGPNAYWSFFIGVKSGILSDIKWDKRNNPDPAFRR